jgi:hypothetical protein
MSAVECQNHTKRSSKFGWKKAKGFAKPVGNAVCTVQVLQGSSGQQKQTSGTVQTLNGED